MQEFTDTMTSAETIHQQLAFLMELDRLKSVIRQSPLANRSRRENSAEHSWHLAMFALVLSEHAERRVDAAHVVKLLLLHDIVEIDAGDSPIHASGTDKAALERAERAAAERIFGLLPPEQAERFLALWWEFEVGETPEARFAKALDRLQPLLVNTHAGGGTWTENGVTEAQVGERYGPAIRGGSSALWEAAAAQVRLHFSTVA
ncbi:HD domain-containing protein [Belnapia sp. T6]|uniref:HD domain-containing protein n=1 Tax=Belnapia mucosa TaxID=2804532 RepID=A0ABS1VAY5_9PROT|nr:HD domain-containing protein [Belnapia mucosa]MBL6458837.1 HD domain-containing protein [Belnapia mucosa]